MITYKTIVLPTDLSPNADVASAYALELAQHYDGQIYLLHVFEDSPYYSAATANDTVAMDPTAWIASAQIEHQEQLEKAAAALEKKSKVRVIPEQRLGHPAAEIVAFAEEKKADAIVIATHGRRGFSHFFFGSVAERVIRTAPCPVLTIRPHDGK